MTKVIRYASPKYSNDLYQDYIDTGLLVDKLELSNEALIETSKFDPGFKPAMIFCAPSTVSIQTAEILGSKFNSEIQVLDDLINIKHDFKHYIKNKEELDSPIKMQILRSSFLEDLLDDNLLEPKDNIYKRLRRVDTKLTESDNSLVITHGILMTAMYLYLKRYFNFRFEEAKKVADTSIPFYGSLKGFDYFLAKTSSSFS